MSLQPSRPPPALSLVHEAPEHAAEIEALLDRAFGPGRFAKSSERVREFADFAPELSFCALEEGRLLGVVRMWRVAVGEQPVAFLGPLAVDTEQRKAGLGGLLISRAFHAAAAAAGEAGVLLVGDPPYFGRFGFKVAPGVIMPGPADPRRVLFRGESGLTLTGPVRAR
jgi:predicted N-acetyltransferase YhbS